MTATLALVKRDDFTGDLNSVSLLAFTDGFSLIDDGWRQQIDGGEDGRVIDTLTFMVRATTQDGLATALQLLDEKIEEVAAYARDEVETYGVWLRAKMNTETGTRQALIRSAKRSPLALWAGTLANPSGGFYYAERYTLALERDEHWEAQTLTVLLANAVGAVGGMVSYSAIAGDAPARLARVQLLGDISSGGALTKLWLGFRTNRFGVAANFVPTWSLRLGTPFGADTTGAATNADATAKDGFKVLTTFATTPALTQRVLISVAGVTVNRADQRGTFLVLLRAKLSGAGTVRVRMLDGLNQSKALKARPRVPISGASYQLYELGTVQIPSPGRAYSATQLLDQFSIAIEAEQIGGTPSTPSLSMDCLILIPMAEGWLSVTIDPLSLQGVTLNQNMQIFSLPDGGLQGIYFGGAGLTPQAILSPRLFGGLPVSGSTAYIIGAAQEVAAAPLADYFNVGISAARRWDTLRGSE